MAEVTIIIPLYNKQDSIRTTIESVLLQDFADFELLVINDGSKDNSLEIVESFKDERIRLINKENEGVSKTRNRGAKEAKSDLIFFLDADDRIYPNCLSVLLKLHNDFPLADLWSANYEKGYNTHLTKVLSDLPRGYVQDMSKMLWLRKWNFRTGSFLCTKSSFLESGGFPTTMTVGEDYFWMDNYCSKYICAYDSSHVIMTYIFDTRGLSIASKPIQNYLEWHLDFTDKWGYRKLRYGELLGISFFQLLLNRKFSEFKKLYAKQGEFFLYSIYALLRRSLRNITQKYESQYIMEGGEKNYNSSH